MLIARVDRRFCNKHMAKVLAIFLNNNGIYQFHQENYFENIKHDICLLKTIFLGIGYMTGHMNRSFTARIVQGGSNMTGTNCDLFTHK
jgi:hypothetical protein